MGGARKLALAFMLLPMVGLLPGCGGGDSSGGTASEPLSAYPKGPTREFIEPYGDNAIPLYGREGTPAELRQASAVIHKWMRARAARDFVEECRYFSRSYIQTLVQGDAEVVTDGRVKTCPHALAYFGSQASGDFKNTLNGPIDSLRVPPVPSKGRAQGQEPVITNQGFAQYHGRDGVDYEIPMNRERGRWRVSAAAPLDQEG